MRNSIPIFQYTLLLILLITGLFVSEGLTATYYVSPNGEDEDSGTSPETPWRSIDKVNSASFAPGDEILFERGGTWRATPLRISSSGSVDQPVTYGTYGENEARPEILGSLFTDSWEEVQANIWRSTKSIPASPRTLGYDAAEVFFEKLDGSVSWGRFQPYFQDLSSLTEEYHWTWNNTNLYIYSNADPASVYSGVEVPQLPTGIYLQDKNYITITGLALQYYGDQAIYDSYATPAELFGLSVTDCEIGYIGRKDGEAAYGLNVHHSDSRYANNEIHNCGRRGISLTMYDTEASIQRNVLIENNHFHHGWHTTSLDCSTIGPHIIENITFRNNLVEGDPAIVLGGENSNSNHVFCSYQYTPGRGRVGPMYFYNNIFTFASGSSIKLGTVNQVRIHHNTFYNFNPSLANWQAHVYTSGVSDQYQVTNNIFHNNAVDNRWSAIKVDNGEQLNFIVNHNLYHQQGSGKRFWWTHGGTHYSVTEWEEYKHATGNDGDSPAPGAPLFVNPPEDFSLQNSSPARGWGEKIDMIDTDYSGTPINSPPDLGALQYREKLQGDLDDDGSVTLADAIIGLNVIAGNTSFPIAVESDINGDRRVGVAEVIWVLQNL